MTYCVGIKLKAGLVFLSDSRTNAGLDQISTFRKMIVYEKAGDRFMVLLSAGNLSISQSVREILQVEQLKDTLRTRHSGLQDVGSRGCLSERMRELARVLNKCLHITKTHRPRRNFQATDYCDRNVVEVSNEHHRRHDRTRDELGVIADIKKFLINFLEAAFNLILLVKHFDDRVPRKGFLNQAVQFTGVFPLGDELLL